MGKGELYTKNGGQWC